MSTCVYNEKMDTGENSFFFFFSQWKLIDRLTDWLYIRLQSASWILNLETDFVYFFGRVFLQFCASLWTLDWTVNVLFNCEFLLLFLNCINERNERPEVCVFVLFSGWSQLPFILSFFFFISLIMYSYTAGKRPDWNTKTYKLPKHSNLNKLLSLRQWDNVYMMTR